MVLESLVQQIDLRNRLRNVGEAGGKDEVAEETEEAEETEPEDKIPVSKEKFDIIKSQGKVKKR